MKELRMPLIAGICMLVLLAGVSLSGIRFGEEDAGLLKVTFLDVGQGDATFIESPSGTQILIDGGKGSSVLGQLESVMGFFDRDIDMVVATHPDMDHIGGLIDVLKRYDVDTILITENGKDTPVADAFLRSIAEEEGVEIRYARRGQVYDLGSGVAGSTTLTILFPDHDPTDLESNTASIVARLVYGTSEFMLTGDSPQEIEEYLVGLGADGLMSDVLKIGHHGSRTSTSEIFVSIVRPLYAVISSGKDNSYGHPHKEVMDRLVAKSIATKNTALHGSITFVSDGTNLQIR